ncbi:hypothetical protein [Mesorhizobium sp. M1027]|uniref:hypothetical protein n=1 Tax=Mesorhizobium sp. M1027 TaxID=2957050 RepID=UPI0033362356
MPAGRQDDRRDLPKSKYPQPDLNQIGLIHRSPRTRSWQAFAPLVDAPAPAQYAALNEPTTAGVPQTPFAQCATFEIFSLF